MNKSELRNKYIDNSFWSLLRLSKNLIFTRILFPTARIIRFPIYIKGKKRIKFGYGFTSGIGLRIDCLKETNDDPTLIFGNNVEINDYVHIGCVHKIQIGNNVLIASKVFISDHNHGLYSGNINIDTPLSTPKSRPLVGKAIFIGDNVWIGETVTILPGVSIGSGSIIGANSVVNKDIPANSIAVGVPAKVIKQFDFVLEKWITLKNP